MVRRLRSAVVLTACMALFQVGLVRLPVLRPPQWWRGSLRFPYYLPPPTLDHGRASRTSWLPLLCLWLTDFRQPSPIDEDERSEAEMVFWSALKRRSAAMPASAYLTTSWDDGHPLDLKLAELLHKHGIPATFYVPKSNVLPVMNRSAVREVAAAFEIGGHTLSHADLALVDEETAWEEIAGCRNFVQDITEVRCRSFCFPKGHYQRSHLAMVRAAGFACARTVETMSVAAPRMREGIAVVPTTIQTYPFADSMVLRNIAKRGALSNALNYVCCRRHGWAETARAFADHVVRNGGVFHLWGHSWEVDECDQWKPLEDLLVYLAARKQYFQSLSNGDLCAALA